MNDALILQEDHTRNVVNVFEFWKKVLNHPRSHLDAQRNFDISKWLQLGYTVEDLCLAIYGCSKSSWHMGLNPKTGGQKFTLIRHVFETADKIDYFIETALEDMQKNLDKQKSDELRYEMDSQHVSKTFTPVEWAALMAEIHARIS